jgi:DNA polymerase III alpha subunit (gram-positive type)
MFAQPVDTVYASYRYIMGDSDSKAEAKQLCFLEAKRICLEQAGTYIESNVTVENYQITKDEINTYAAAFVQVEIVSEEIENLGETMAINTTVKAIVNQDEMKNYIEQVKSDAEMEQQLQEKDQERQNLEKNVNNLKEKLQNATPEQRARLKEEMTQALKQMNSFEKRKQQVRIYTRKAVENIRMGMTPKQVVEVAGPPVKKIAVNGDARLNYGLVWLVFERGKVSCLVKEPHFKPKLRCRDYKPQQKFVR